MIKKQNHQQSLWDYFLFVYFSYSTKKSKILQKISEILDSHPEILEEVWRGVNRKQNDGQAAEEIPKDSTSNGSRSATLTVEQLLRIFIYKQLFKLSYRRLEEELHENIGVKRFTRLYSPEFDSWRGF